MAERSAAAIRYAEAIFEVARNGQTFDLWLRELSEVERLLGDQLAARVLASPAIPRDRKARILDQALPDLSDPVRRFLNLLLRRGRVGLLPRVMESLRERIDRQRGVERARVTTAVPLEPADRELIAARLAARTGKRIEIEEAVDPHLLGGVVAQIGDEIIDGSVRGRLERLRRTLAGT